MLVSEVGIDALLRLHAPGDNIIDAVAGGTLGLLVCFVPPRRMTTAFLHFFATFLARVFVFLIYDDVQPVKIVGNGARYCGPTWHFPVLGPRLVIGGHVDSIMEK